jgi:hypothetical protein
MILGLPLAFYFSDFLGACATREKNWRAASLSGQRWPASQIGDQSLPAQHPEHQGIVKSGLAHIFQEDRYEVSYTRQTAELPQ